MKPFPSLTLRMLPSINCCQSTRLTIQTLPTPSLLAVPITYSKPNANAKNSANLYHFVMTRVDRRCSNPIMRRPKMYETELQKVAMLKYRATLQCRMLKKQNLTYRDRQKVTVMHSRGIVCTTAQIRQRIAATTRPQWPWLTRCRANTLLADNTRRVSARTIGFSILQVIQKIKFKYIGHALRDIGLS